MVVSDIEEMLGYADLYKIFNKNKFLIKDESVREYLRLDPLDDNYLDAEKNQRLI